MHLNSVWKKVGITAAAILLLLGGAALLGYRAVIHLIVSRMHAPALAAAPEAPDDLVYRTLDGAEQRLSATKGQVVFLDLWGTWCIQCVAEMPTVQKLYDHYRNDPQVRFLIVSRLDSPDTVRAWARRHHYDLPFYVMNDEDIPQSMRLNQYPATFIYAKDGSLVAKHVGASNWADPAVIQFIDGLKTQ